MIILGIESSCDDTSVALIDITDKRIEILAEKTASQIEVHKKYGGVVPEIAGRLHAEKILPVIESVFAEATPDKEVIKPDVIAVTSGPGLITGLLVGVEASKTLSYLWNVPIVSVNHIEGHIHSVQIQNHKSKIVNKFNYPVLSLVASGGHSEIILSTEEGKYEKIGGTCDDAAGECFDKVAKLLGFDYPGGPKISQFAETGNPEAIKFPRPMIDSDNFDFSFSGLKTSALYWLRDNDPIVIPTVTNEERVSEADRVSPKALAVAQGSLSYTPTNLKLKAKAEPKAKGSLGGACPAVRCSEELSGSRRERSRRARDDIDLNDFCASFEQAIVDLLVFKTLKAVKEHKPKTVILGGGVSANKKLRTTLEGGIKKQSPLSTFCFPLSTYCMDNATMIAVAAYHHAKSKDFTNWKDLEANPNWKVYEKNT